MFYETLGQSVEVIVSGQHPSVRPDDFVLIEDTKNGGEVVSSGGLLNRTWRYADVSFVAGYLECIATAPEYQRQGFMNRVIAALHAISADHGHHVQTIDGIRWFYRRFGYEYALEGAGHREFPFAFVPTLAEGEEESFQVRPAQEQDLPILMQLYERQRSNKLVSTTRPESLWRYQLAWRDQGALGVAYYTILDQAGTIVGYYGTWGDLWGRHIVREFSVREGTALSAVLPSVLRYIKAAAKAFQTTHQTYRPVTIQFDLGFDHNNLHMIYQALDDRLTPYRGWTRYIRVADLPAFLLHIAPVLEQRLSESDMSGFDGDLLISFYKGGLRLQFENGKLTTAEDWTSPTIDEGHDAAFPDLTFLKLLFGYRSLAELRDAFPDCWVNRKAILLLNVLFPKQPSWSMF